jgi:hypothetical protein
MRTTTRSGRAGRGTLASLLVVLVAAMCLVPAAAHAEGSFCTDGGVNVAVDYQDLGGGVEQVCDEDGAGKTAAQVFEESGFELTPVQPFPGAACQVEGEPADATCAKMPPADAYWGLFLAKNGKWGYAPKGADELKLADGAFVAFSWQGSKTPAPPSVDPVKAQPGSAETSADTDASAAEEDAEDSSVAWWIPVLVVVLLGAAGAAIALRRRTARS